MDRVDCVQYARACAAGCPFFGNTFLVLERPAPAAGWISVLSSRALVPEWPSSGAGWICVDW